MASTKYKSHREVDIGLSFRCHAKSEMLRFKVPCYKLISLETGNKGCYIHDSNSCQALLFLARNPLHETTDPLLISSPV